MKLDETAWLHTLSDPQDVVLWAAQLITDLDPRLSNIARQLNKTELTYKSGALARTTTTLTDDPDLRVLAAANSVYALDAVLTFTCPVLTVDAAVAVNAPPSSNINVAVTFLPTNATNLEGDILQTVATGSVRIDCGVVAASVVMQGTVATGATVGDIAVQWAQFVADVNNPLTLESGAYMRLVRL